jgi:hypothetical protein
VPTLSQEVRGKLAKTIQHSQIYAQNILIYDIAELCGKWSVALEAYVDGAGASKDKLREYCNIAIALDRKLKEWTLALPLEWLYSVTSVEKQENPQFLWPLLEGKWFPEASQCYASLVAEVKWRLHFAVKLVLNHALLHTVNLIESTGESLEPHISRQEIECELLNLVDRICESCLVPFTTPVLSNPRPTCVEEICSARGYMLLQTLPAVYLCLIQAPIASVDISGRLEWVTKMLGFLQTKMGFAKGAHMALAKASTLTGDSQRKKFALQLWGLRN